MKRPRRAALPRPAPVRAAGAFLVLACACTLAAAQPASRVTPRDLRPETPPPAVAPVPPQDPPAARPALPGGELVVTVGRIQVENGFAEFAAATQALVAPVEGQRVSVAALYQMAERIEGLYRAAGFVLARVVVPPQSLRDGGSLRILVVDGFIEHVDVAGLDERVRTEVQATLAPLVGRPRLRSDDLERLLTLAGRSPGAALRSTLAPGTRAGASVLVIEGTFERVTGSWGVDNRLSQALGPWQGTIQLRLNQPTGHGEQAYAYVAGHPNPGRMFAGDAARRVAGAGVILPVGRDGFALNGEYTWSDTNSPGVAFVPATRSRFERFALRATHPLVLRRAQEVTLTGALEASSQATAAPDFGLVLNEDRLRVLRAGIDSNEVVGEGGRLRLSALLSRGVAQLGARTRDDAIATGVPLSRPGAEPRFTKLEGGLHWDHVHASGLSFRTVLRAQLPFGGPLPSAELFSLDGEDALSSLPSGALSDDGGWTFRQEVGRHFAFGGGESALPLQPYAFFAGGRNYSKVDTPTGFSTSWGAGLRTGWKAVSFSLELGRSKIKPSGFVDTKLFAKGQVAF